MTLYEQILTMNIEEMAEFFYEICHEKDIQFLKYLNDNNIPASLVEVDKNIQINMNIQLLKSERGK